MGMKTLKPGEDFSFPREFGFSGSAGAVSPRRHPTMSSDEFGDDAQLSREAETPTFAKGGKAMGGPATLPGGKPMPKAGKAIMGALQLGKVIGQATAAKGGGQAMGAPAPGAAPVGLGALPRPGAGVIPGGMPGTPPGGLPMKRGGRAKKMADGGSADGSDTRFTGTPSRAMRDSVEEAETRVLNSHQASDKARSSEPLAKWGADSNVYVEKAKGGFIKGAIKHPGRMKNLAKEHGVSVHKEMEHDKHSSSPSLRSAANLGLRLTGGDLAHKRKR